VAGNTDGSIRIMGNVELIRTLRNKVIRIGINLNEVTTRNPQEMAKLWEAYHRGSEIEFVGFAIKEEAVKDAAMKLKIQRSADEIGSIDE